MPGYRKGLSVKRRLSNDDEREAPSTTAGNFISLLEHEQGVKHTNSTDQEGRNQRLTHLRTCTLSRDHHHDRRHSRGAIREASQPTWTLNDLSSVDLILRDHAIALNCLQESGWVHRDISAGNIYFLAGRELAGDSDLDYARRATKDGSRQIRAGTPDFMAVEVSMNAYQFLPSKSSSDVSKRMKLFEDSNYYGQPEPRFQFVQNEGHDIESLWWISNYILFFNHNDSAQETRDQEEARMVWITRIFPSSDLLMFRGDFLRDSGTYEKNTQWFSSSFLELRNVLEEVGSALVASYTEMEATLPNIVEGVFNNLYDITTAAFRICMNRSSNITISSFKTKGRKHQKELSQASSPPPLQLTMVR